jgi:hypothetical protein
MIKRLTKISPSMLVKQDYPYSSMDAGVENLDANPVTGICSNVRYPCHHDVLDIRKFITTNL